MFLAALDSLKIVATSTVTTRMSRGNACKDMARIQVDMQRSERARSRGEKRRMGRQKLATLGILRIVEAITARTLSAIPKSPINRQNYMGRVL